MKRYFLKTLGFHLGQGRVLFLLTLLGVALGVASVLCIQILNMNALGSFQGSVRAVSGDASLSIQGVQGSLPEELYPQVLVDKEVESAWPLYRVDVAVTLRPPIR